MDKALLLYRGGVRSVVRTLADGAEHTLYYKARTPNELAVYFGAESTFGDDEKGNLARQKARARFIADSLCTEDGEPLLTLAEAELVPGTLKAEICQFVIAGSNEAGPEKND